LIGTVRSSCTEAAPDEGDSMTLRYNRCQILFMAVLMVVLATSSVGRASGVVSTTAEEATTVDTLNTPTKALPPWQQTLSGQDSVRVAELKEQVTELREKAKYAEAILLADEALEIRRRVQGEGHWEVTDAVKLVETLKYIAGLPAEAQAELAEADRLTVELEGLRGRGEYEEGVAVAQRQLEIRRRLLGQDHLCVAMNLQNLGVLLFRQGDYAGAEPVCREALAMMRKLLSEEHSKVASSLNNLAVLLWFKGDYAGAEPLCREALAMKRKLLGEEHPDVARSLSNLAALLQLKGDYAGAEPLHREALAMRRKLLGEEHPDVAASLNNLAVLLWWKGDYAGAEPLCREALAMKRRLLGEEHPDVAGSLNNLAGLLDSKGDYAGSEPLYREALAMYRKLLGKEHPHVASSLNNLAGLLRSKGDCAGAEPLYREALAMWRKLLGEEHPDVATSLNNLAVLLEQKGDYAAAEPLHREALAMRRKLLGEEHPDVARSLSNLALLLAQKGDHAGAEPLWREALATYRKRLGEAHPDVASDLHNLAELLYSSGDYGAAETAWVAAAESFEAARLRASAAGLERAGFATEQSPLAPLAACLARNGKPVPAWARLETNMARGLLDEVSARLSRPLEPEERDREEGLLGQLAKLDERISASLSADDSTGEADAWADTLRWRREALVAELTRFQADMAAKYGVAAGETYELGRIQETLSEDAALLAWVDVKGDSHAVDPNGEHWACVVRHQGGPVWVKLPGSGDDGGWTESDNELHGRVRDALGDGASGVEGEAHQGLMQELYTQRLAPVEPRLAGVGRLIVLPAGWMAGLPVEALTDDYAVSYAPSATMYAWLTEGRKSQVPGPDFAEATASAGGLRRPGATSGKRGFQEETPRPPRSGEEAWRPLLALGDPVFEQPAEPDTVLPEPPDQGVMLAMVMDGSNAARGGLRSGDVILSYGDDQLGSADDLGPAIEQVAEATEDSSSSVRVRVWREGETLDVTVTPGDLGVNPSSQPAPEAVRSRQRLDSVLEQTRGTTFEPLPGSRLEVEAIAELFAAEAEEATPTLLLGPEASERRLGELATSGDLGRYRHIHLATHAVMDDEVAMRSALILSEDPDDDALERALEGKEVYDGRLTAEQIVRTWKLNADLVTLSGCETALGKASGGEGFLGFSQALFVAGARSLVLSLWEVDDTPTMLLMKRFYENLLGRFEEPRRVADQTYAPGTPLSKVDALREAKIWLRELTWDDVGDLVAELSGGTRGRAAEDLAVVAGDSEYPYEHPHYWAAFILMGNPD
jgi:CHAT domain-containing protein/Flp pilus assembly protein TadD